jgi:hypothetical protein
MAGLAVRLAGFSLRNSPQCLHFRALALIFSAQKGQVLVADSEEAADE